MGNIIRLESISQLNALFQQTAPKHPLIAVIDFSKMEKHEKVEEIKLTCGFYSVMFKNHCANKLKYGKEYYDFQEGIPVQQDGVLVSCLIQDIHEKKVH